MNDPHFKSDGVTSKIQRCYTASYLPGGRYTSAIKLSGK